jgi:hypothetical protein
MSIQSLRDQAISALQTVVTKKENCIGTQPYSSMSFSSSIFINLPGGNNIEKIVNKDFNILAEDQYKY